MGDYVYWVEINGAGIPQQCSALNDGTFKDGDDPQKWYEEMTKDWETAYIVYPVKPVGPIYRDGKLLEDNAN